MRRERGWVGEGVLLASCRLNKSRVKEMEREKQALFRHKLLLFEGWNRKRQEQMGHENNAERTKESRQQERGDIYDKGCDSRSQSPSPTPLHGV